MPVTFRFAWYGDQQFHRTLDRIELALDDATPLWEWLVDYLEQVEREQFDSEGARSSGGWPELSPRYAEWKARHYPGQPILRRENDLYESFTDSSAGGAIRIIEPRRLIFGSAVEYGAHHQRGGDNLPQRRPIELTESDRVLIGRQAHYYLIEGKIL